MVLNSGEEMMSSPPTSNGAPSTAQSLVMTDAQEIMWSLTSSACKPKLSHDDSTCQYGKRIITFTGVVCVVCTAIVITVVVTAALFLHQYPKGSNSSFPSSIYIIPNPEQFNDRPLTVVFHRRNIQKLKSQIAQIQILLKTYYEMQNADIGVCDCDPPSEIFACRFPLGSINKNCSLVNKFGYDSGNPCIALVLQVTSDWKPEPFSTSMAPITIRSEYDPNLVYLTCSTSLDCGIIISYSPFHGFPSCYFPSRSSKENLPPLVMMQFLEMPFNVEVEVKCQFWAKNIYNIDNDKVFNELRFNLVIT